MIKIPHDYSLVNNFARKGFTSSCNERRDNAVQTSLLLDTDFLLLMQFDLRFIDTTRRDAKDCVLWLRGTIDRSFRVFNFLSTRYTGYMCNTIFCFIIVEQLLIIKVWPKSIIIGISVIRLSNNIVAIDWLLTFKISITENNWNYNFFLFKIMLQNIVRDYLWIDYILLNIRYIFLYR